MKNITFETAKEIVERRTLEVEYCKSRDCKCGSDIKTGRKECPFLIQFEGCMLATVIKPGLWNLQGARERIESRKKWDEYWEENNIGNGAIHFDNLTVGQGEQQNA